MVPAGYHNMCRWNFMGMMQHPKIRDLDYYCRMDTDSRIRAKVRLLVSLLSRQQASGNLIRQTNTQTC